MIPFLLLGGGGPVAFQATTGYAILGAMRLNAARLNYYQPKVYLTVGGTRRETLALLGTARISKARGARASSATVRVKQFTPQVGQEILFGVGTVNNRLFGGVIQRVDQPANNTALPFYDLTCVGFRWLLDRRLVIKHYPVQAVDAIVQDLITTYTSGFTTTHVQTGLPSLSITFNGDVTVGEALDQLKTRVEDADWYVDDYGGVHFFTGTENLVQPQPVTVLNTDRSFGFTKQTDLSQVRTRVYVTGHRATVTTAAVVGATAIEIDDASRLASAGGSALVEGRVVTYTGIAELAAPGAPTVASLGSLVGRLAGAYTYKVAFATHTGETLAGTASASVTPPSVAPPVMGLGNTSAGALNGEHKYKYSFAGSGAETDMSGELTVNGTNYSTNVPLVTSSDPRITSRKIYRTIQGGSTYFLLKVIGDNTTLTYNDNLSDVELTNIATFPPQQGQIYGGVVNLTAIPTSADTSVTARKLYRTKGGGSIYQHLATIGDNTTTVHIDATADTDLGDQPVSPSSYPDRVTGIPASGTGSIIQTIAEGAELRPLVQVDDTAAQTALALLVGGDGIHEHHLQVEDAGSVADLQTAGVADLARFSAALPELHFGSRDDHFVPGTVATVNLPASPINVTGTFDVQEVTITDLELTLQRYPLRQVTAAKTQFTLTDFLRRPVQ
jgi:hypothetical protein